MWDENKVRAQGNSIHRVIEGALENSKCLHLNKQGLVLFRSFITIGLHYWYCRGANAMLIVHHVSQSMNRTRRKVQAP